MKKVKRKNSFLTTFLTLILTFALIFSFTSCNDSDSNDNTIQNSENGDENLGNTPNNVPEKNREYSDKTLADLCADSAPISSSFKVTYAGDALCPAEVDYTLEHSVSSVDNVDITLYYGFRTYYDISEYEIRIVSENYTHVIEFKDGPYYKEDFAYTYGEEDNKIEYTKSMSLKLPKELFVGEKVYGNVSITVYAKINTDKVKSDFNSQPNRLYYRTDGENVMFHSEYSSYYSGCANFFSSVWSSDAELGEEEIKALEEKYGFFEVGKYFISNAPIVTYHSKSLNPMSSADVIVGMAAKNGQSCIQTYSYNPHSPANFKKLNRYKFNYIGEFSVERVFDGINIYLWNDNLAIYLEFDEGGISIAGIKAAVRMYDIIENDYIRDETLELKPLKAEGCSSWNTGDVEYSIVTSEDSSVQKLVAKFESGEELIVCSKNLDR